jgi:hypothetical protein
MGSTASLIGIAEGVSGSGVHHVVGSHEPMTWRR